MGGRTIKCIWHCFLVDKGSDRYLSPIQCHMHILSILLTLAPIVVLIFHYVFLVDEILDIGKWLFRHKVFLQILDLM